MIFSVHSLLGRGTSTRIPQFPTKPTSTSTSTFWLSPTSYWFPTRQPTISTSTAAAAAAATAIWFPFWQCPTTTAWLPNRLYAAPAPGLSSRSFPTSSAWLSAAANAGTTPCATARVFSSSPTIWVCSARPALIYPTSNIPGPPCKSCCSPSLSTAKSHPCRTPSSIGP